MFRAGAVLCWLAVLSSLSFAEPIIEQHNRVPNHKKFGVCWFACAEMIAKQYRIPGFMDLTKRVVEDGLGFKTGATEESVLTWATRQKVKIDYRSDGTKDKEFVFDAIWNRKLPVITSHKWFNDSATHAILLVDITDTEVDFTDEDQVRHKTYRVRYINPNAVADNYICQRTWQWWYTSWTGRACVIDPASQEKSQTLPVPNNQPPVLAAKTQAFAKHLQPAYHALPPGPVAKVGPIPSNQDIKDGIHRPDDRLHYGGYDYSRNYYLPKPSP